MVQSASSASSSSASSASSSRSAVTSPLRKKSRFHSNSIDHLTNNRASDIDIVDMDPNTNMNEIHCKPTTRCNTTSSSSSSNHHLNNMAALRSFQYTRKGDAHWDLGQLLHTATAFPNQSGALALGEFDATSGHETLQFLQQECKVLIIGAGGLGCELLKNCVLSGFGHIEIIDMDTIDVSNLNRQFLFRQQDVGKSKAYCAAQFVQQRMQARGGATARGPDPAATDPTAATDAAVAPSPPAPPALQQDVEIRAHFKRVQDMDLDFYRQFHVILSGLDNIEARRFVNSVVVSLAEVDAEGNVDPSTIIPLIDGGTEGLRGQARVIIPRVTSCFECSLESFPPQTVFPMCTIAETPRQPAHCIAYALLVLWPKKFPDKSLNKDDPDHMQWVFATARDRAEQYGIQGVTYSLTLGVVKNIIPAVASTNAIVAALCVNEACKAMTYCSQLMNNYHMHMGSRGCYSHTFEYQRKAQECVVCCSQQRRLVVPKDWTLQHLVDHLVHHASFRLRKPSISCGGHNWWMQGPPSLQHATSKNLPCKLSELLKDNDHVLTITDPVLAGDMALELKLCFEN